MPGSAQKHSRPEDDFSAEVRQSKATQRSIRVRTLRKFTERPMDAVLGGLPEPRWCHAKMPKWVRGARSIAGEAPCESPPLGSLLDATRYRPQFARQLSPPRTSVERPGWKVLDKGRRRPGWCAARPRQKRPRGHRPADGRDIAHRRVWCPRAAGLPGASRALRVAAQMSDVGSADESRDVVALGQ